DFGIPREVFEYRNVEDMIERRHARLHAIAKLSPGPPRAGMSDKTRVSCKALRMVASKQLSHGRKLEAAVNAFDEQAHARESSKQAIDPVFRDTSFTGNIAAPPRSLRELFGDADFDDSAECLTDPLADHHLKKDLVWTRWGGPIGSAFGHRSPKALCRLDSNGVARER